MRKWAALTVRRAIILSRTLRCRKNRNTGLESTGVCAAAILNEYRPVLYANLLTSGTLHRHLAEIDQACNKRMEIIVSAMVKQESVTETLKATDQMEWVRRMNSIRSRAEEIFLTELVYE